MQEFLQAIKGAFDQFKMALEKRGVLVDHFTTVLDKNTLQIRIPSPKYFDAFIKVLAEKNLLVNPVNKLSKGMATSPNPLDSKKDEIEEVKRVAMSPFSTQLKLTL